MEEPVATAAYAGSDAKRRVEWRVGQGLSEFLALEPHWRALAARLPHPRFMHDFDWHFAYSRHLASNADSTCYVSFFHDSQAIAIFPLRRVRRAVGRIPLRLWELPTHAHIGLCDALIAPEWSTVDLIRQLILALDRKWELPWDALHLPLLIDDTVVVSTLRGNLPPGTRLDHTGTSMYFRCDGDIDSALANCSSRFKRNLRRQGNKLARHGALTLTLAREGAELDAAFDDFLHLEASGWKGMQGRASAIALHAHLCAFYRELKDRFAARGACLIPLLKLDDVAIAAQFCLLSGSTLYLQKIAYDEAWHFGAPGSQLLRRVIEHCCARPDIDELNLITGPAWAGRWKPKSRPVWNAYVFNSSPRALLAQTVRRFRIRVVEPARTLLHRNGLPDPE